MPVYAGHDLRAYYVWEDGTYAGSTTDTDYKPLGADARITTAEGSNEALRLHDPDSREATVLVPQRFAGSFAAEFVVTNAWWLRMMLGAPTTTGASAPYTHTFNAKYGTPFQLHIGRENDNDAVILKGCVARTISITVSVDEVARVTIDGFYVDEDPNGTIQTQPALVEDPLSFYHADITVDGTTLALVQDATITFELNAEPIGELGTRLSVDNAQRTRAPDIQFTKIKEASDDSLRTDLYGASGGPASSVAEDNCTFVLDNGGAGSDQNKITFTFTGSMTNTYGRGGIGDHEQEFTEEVNRMVREVTAVANNGTSTAR